jgi:hypothetical protein
MPNRLIATTSANTLSMRRLSIKLATAPIVLLARRQGASNRKRNQGLDLGLAETRAVALRQACWAGGPRLSTYRRFDAVQQILWRMNDYHSRTTRREQ